MAIWGGVGLGKLRKMCAKPVHCGQRILLGNGFQRTDRFCTVSITLPTRSDILVEKVVPSDVEELSASI